MGTDDQERPSGVSIRVSKTAIFLGVGTFLAAAIQYLASSWLRNPALELDDHGDRIELLEKRYDKIDVDYISEELEEIRHDLDEAQYDIKNCQRNMSAVLADNKLHKSESQSKFQSLDKQYTILDFQIGQCIKRTEQ